MGVKRIDNPGAPPRSIGLGQVLKHLPAMTQISLVIFPPLVVVGVVALALGGGRSALGLIAVPGAVLALHVWLAWAHYRKLAQYPAVLGRIIGYSNPTNFQTSHLTILHFDFEATTGRHSGEQVTVWHPSLPLGAPIWILCNPINPRDSIPWIE